MAEPLWLCYWIVRPRVLESKEQKEVPAICKHFFMVRVSRFELEAS